MRVFRRLRRRTPGRRLVCRPACAVRRSCRRLRVCCRQGVRGHRERQQTCCFSVTVGSLSSLQPPRACCPIMWLHSSLSPPVPAALTAAGFAGCLRHSAKPAAVRLTLPPCLLPLSCLRLLLSPPTLRRTAQCRSLTLAAQPPRITTAPAVLDACCLGSPAGIAVATGFPRPAPASPVSSGNPPVDINHRV